METGAQDWAFSCGQCHAGGGQMEYDRDRNPYSASSGTGDYYYYKPPTLDAPAGGIVAGSMSGTNKAEVDCLLCHLNDNSGISGNGRAFLNSMDCNGRSVLPGVQLGPNNDPNCTYALDSTGHDPALADPGMMGRNGAGMYLPGTKYDSFNRTLAIQDKQFNYAASLGIGAKANLSMAADGHLHIDSISGVPAQIAAANIQATPNSQNCTVCHGRDDNTPGLPGMLNPVRYGYGIYLIINPKSTVLDVDPTTTEKAALGDPTPGSNAVRWMEMGCKTGMGKRGHKTGEGPNDKWGMSLFSAMFGLGIGPGTPITNATYPTPLGPLVTKAKMPDQDVHDAAGFQCATCHYGLGSTSLQGGALTIAAATEHGVAYPSETILGIDHNFAQGDSLKDNYGMNQIDGTVSCESCHITRDNPRIAAGQINPPVPAHAGLPQLHLDKIGCTTCHIPEIYIQPFKLKYRDFTVGKFKRGTETAGGNKNVYDFSYDFVTGSGDSVKQLHQWAHKYGETKIYPVTPIEVNNWVSIINNGAITSAKVIAGTTPDASTPDYANNNNTSIVNLSTETNALRTCKTGVRVGWTCATDADCPGYTSIPDPGMGSGAIAGACQPGNAVKATPPMSRDIVDITAAAIADGSLQGVRINGGAMAPVFDYWVLTDNLSMDTIAKRNAMRAKSLSMFPGDASKQLSFEKIFHAAFDETHGVAPKEWALGAAERGGCIMCHSSANPMSPNFSPYSVGFFEGLQPYTERATQFQPAANAPLSDRLVPMIGAMFVGKFDLMKNPVALFADFDCTKEFCGAGTCGGAACSTRNVYGVAGQDLLGSMLQGMGVQYDSPLTPDSYYFNQMTGALNDPGAPCSANSLLWDLGAMNPAYTGMGIRTIGQCTALMNAGFDAMMGLPHSVVPEGAPGAGTPVSTAGMMGFSDGIAGLQGLFLRETQDGTPMGCSTMPGPFHQAYNIGSFDPYGNVLDVNNCMPKPSFVAPTAGMIGFDLPVGMLFAGTCTGNPSADGMWPATCRDGFRNGQGCLPDVNMMCTGNGAPMPCCTGQYTGVCPNAPVPAEDHIPAANRNGMCMAAGNPFSCCTGPGAGTCLALQDRDIDCIGGLAVSESMFQFSRDPFGSLGSLMYPRAQQRAHNKVNLQSNGPADLTWPILAERNPDNADHKASWDQAARCLTNYGFMGPDVPCGTTGTGYCVGQDGTSADRCVNVKTYVSANDLLGFTPTQLSSLTTPGISGYGTPQAYFIWDNDAALSNTVDFDASGSSCANPPCTAYTWDFGDGTAGAGVTTAHTYQSTGSYSVKLTVTDVNGVGGQLTHSVTVRAPNLSPTAAGLAGGALTGTTFSFTDASTDPATNSPGGITSLQVIWGDGAADNGVRGGSFSHTYASLGNFTIRHTVGDAAGLWQTETRGITLTAASYASVITVNLSGIYAANVNLYLQKYLNGNWITQQQKLNYTGASWDFKVSSTSGTWQVVGYKSGQTVVKKPVTFSGNTATVAIP